MNILNFKLKGLTCSACVKLVTSRIKKIPGVQEIKIDLGTGAALVGSVADINNELIKLSLSGTNYQVMT